LFFDPQRWWPRGRALWRIAQKKLGFRYLMDVIPLDATLVRGSHGLPSRDAADGPLFIGSGSVSAGDELPMEAVRDLVLGALELN